MWAKFIQLFLRTLCAALALGILPKPDEVKSGAVRAGKRRREAGGFSQPPGDSFCTALDISEAKPRPATTAHKGPNTAFQPLGGAWTPPGPQARHKSPQEGWHEASCFRAVAQNELYGYWQRKLCRKKYRLL